MLKPLIDYLGPAAGFFILFYRDEVLAVSGPFFKLFLRFEVDAVDVLLLRPPLFKVEVAAGVFLPPRL